MANSNGWGDGASNNDIGWGQGADNAIGWGSIYANSWAGATDIVGTPAVDPDAQAFITAASITDPTQQSAINQLVVDLKGYNIWTKMKALYPFVGGTSSTHKWNLKDPRDLNVAFRLGFAGGWTHSSTGALPNGTNAYANTYLIPSTSLGLNNTHISSYIRTSSQGILMGVDTNFRLWITPNLNGSNKYAEINTTSVVASSPIDTSAGMYLGSRLSATASKMYKNGVVNINNTTSNSAGLPSSEIILAARNINTPIPDPGYFWSNSQIAFASIGDGLTDAEAANFYTAVQTFQTALGRSIGTQTVSDADAQAFVTNAGIVDQVEANAINTLVIGLKADGLWTKMQAIYPMVGGTASAHSYNLRNTAQYQITWAGGLTHSSTGVLPNGTNGYGNTGFYFDSTTALSSHISTYIRTNTTTLACEFGSGNIAGVEECFIVRSGSTYLNNQCDAQTGRLNPSVADARGLILNSRTANNSWKTYRNGSSLATGTLTNSYTGGSSYILNLFRRGGPGTNDLYSAKECAFASIGDGLTDTDATNLNSRVTTFQTALNRNV